MCVQMCVLVHTHTAIPGGLEVPTSTSIVERYPGTKFSTAADLRRVCGTGVQVLVPRYSCGTHV